jgi:hypothetical protein
MENLSTGDDWKGEHLIRSARSGKPKPGSGLCRECSKKLSDDNVTGYCKDHRNLGRRYGGRGGAFKV